MARKRPADKMAQVRDSKQVKRLALVAMFSDDEFMEKLVLKGGNALALIHNINGRMSFDIDMSMEGEFSRKHLDQIEARIKYRLTQAFRDSGYFLFDFHFEERPSKLTDDLLDFWGGYLIEFKIIEQAKYEQHRHNLDALRRKALPMGPRLSTKQSVEISKHEYCEGKMAVDVDGYTIYVYTPQMIVCEKLRAICQQRPSYTKTVMKHRAPRARDFFDIHEVVQQFGFNITDDSIHEMLDAIFAVKRVPRRLLDEIDEDREFHRHDWISIQATVEACVDLKDFEYYFDFVVDLVHKLQAIRNK